jgi:hypothetical protein
VLKPRQEFEERAVEYNWEASAQPARSFFFLRTNMETKTTYEFCILCGPEEDAPVDANWETVICRGCAYNEAHGHDHVDEMMNPEDYH